MKIAADTRSERKSKDNESSYSKNKLGSEGLSSSFSGKTNRSTRLSVQETLSKQVVSSTASTRKSERLEKGKQLVHPVKRKSERLEQQNTLSPLRRSDRCRKDSPSTPSRSSNSGRELSSSSIKKMDKRERVVKELITESENVSTSKSDAAAASTSLKRKRMDARTFRSLYKKPKKEGTVSDPHEDGDIDGEHRSRSSSHLLSEVELVEPEERRILYNEQKSLHAHLKAENSKLFGVLKVSEDIKCMAEKFLEYIMENHRVSREPETILQAFQISLCWTAASILKQKIDKDDIFLLVKQHLEFRCSKEEANTVYEKLRSLKKMFLQRLDQNGNASNSSRYPISAVKSVGKEPNKGSLSQAVVPTRVNMITEINGRLRDKELSGGGVGTPKEKFMDTQKEKSIKEVQNRHDRKISELGQKQQEELEVLHEICKKKEVLEEESRLEVAVLHSIHGQTAEPKDRQKALETEFARKTESHKCLKDQQLKEVEAKYSAKRNEMQKFSSSCSRNIMESQREKIIKEGQYKHDRRISMLRQKQQDEIEELHRAWEKKKKVLEEECRLEIAVLHTIHGQTAAAKDRQKALETEFARKMEEHKFLKDRQLKELEVKYLAKRNEQMQKFSSWCAREKSILGGHDADEELHLLESDSEDEMSCFLEPVNVAENIHKTVDPVCGEHVELLSPGNIVYGTQGDRTASHEPVSSPVECHVLPVQSTGVLASSVSEEQWDITSSERALIAAVEQSNQAGISSGSKEEVTGKVPLPPKEHIAEIASDERSRDCSMEISKTTLNKSVDNDQISDTENIMPESNPWVPLPPKEHTGEVSSNQQSRDHPMEISETALNGIVGDDQISDRENNMPESNPLVPLPPKGHTGEVSSDIQRRDCPGEISETALNGVVGDDQIPDRENNMLESNSNLPIVVENGRDEANSIGGNGITPEEMSVDVPCAEAVPSSHNASFSPQSPVHLNECARPPGDNGVHSNNMPLSENQIGIQIEAAAGCSISNSSETILIDSCEQPHTGGGVVPITIHHTQGKSAPQTHDARNSIPITGPSPHLDRDTAGALHQAVSPAGEILEPCASVVSDKTDCHNQSILPAVSRVHPQSRIDLFTSSQNTETAFPVVQSSGDLPSQAVSQPNTSIPFVQRSRDIPVHPARQMATRNAALPFHADPLHIECERIRQETEQVTKGHDNMKSLLRSEYEKEIQDVIAPIRKKYALKLQEAEDAYLLKKNELDTNGKKILNHKFLASAFRFMCMDLDISMFPGGTPVYMQHRDPVCLQHNLRSSPMTGLSSASMQPSGPACSGSSPISGLSSSHQSDGEQASVPISSVANRSVHSAGISRPTLRAAPLDGSSTSGQPAASQQAAAVSHSSAFSAGIVRRPPFISSISPSMGNLRLGSEIRAPAPHLQASFRASVSAPASSPSTFSNGLQGHSRPINMVASSPSLPKPTSLQSTSHVLQHQIQPPTVPRLPVNPCDSRNTLLEHGLEGMPATQNPFLSAQGLLLEMENRSRANRPNNMLPLPDIGCNFLPLDLSAFQSLESVQGGSTSSVTATNWAVTEVYPNLTLGEEALGKYMGPVNKRLKIQRSIKDKIAELQKLVSPHGQSDTASVLHEAYKSIMALQDQIQNLCNMESSDNKNSDSPFHSQNSRGKEIDALEKQYSLGSSICLVPVSLVQKLTDEDVNKNMTVMDD